MKKEKKITIRVTNDEYERIEKIVKKLNVPKVRLIRNLTLILLEDLELFKLLGFDNVSGLIFNLQKRSGLHLPRTDACARPQGDAS